MGSELGLPCSISEGHLLYLVIPPLFTTFHQNLKKNPKHFVTYVIFGHKTSCRENELCIPEIPLFEKEMLMQCMLPLFSEVGLGPAVLTRRTSGHIQLVNEINTLLKQYPIQF